MASPLTTYRRWVVPASVITVLLVLAGAASVRPELGDLLGPPGIALGMGTASFLMFRRSARLGPWEKTAWRLFSLGAASAATGVLLTGILVSAGVDLPAFGPVDVFFLGTYVAIVFALGHWARADSSGRAWVLTLFDAVIGAIALATLVWAFIHDRVTEALVAANWWEWVVALVYPVVDVTAVIALGLLVMRRSHFRWDPRLLFVATTLLIQTAADLNYLYTGIGNSFIDAQPAYPLFLLAAASAVVAGAISDVSPPLRQFADKSASLLALIWPYILVAALLVTHVVRYHAIAPPGGDAMLLDALLVIGLIAFVRQMVVIHRQRTSLDLQRSELVASVSHELRTPLTAMVGYLTLLEESASDFPEDARREMLADASSEARHMARLVSDLVLLARGRQQPIPIDVTETAVSDVVNGALRGLDSGGASVVVDVEEDVAVRLDGDRIRQAVSNLLTNAIRYGGDRVLVTAAVRNGRDLVFEVHDNGQGLPTRYENSVWERFERGAHRLNANTPGMGIGLSIVRAVAEAHGGEAVYSRSLALGGACFTLIIPACVAGHQQIEVKSPTSSFLRRY